ncbi:hypothetical protein P5673_012801 [Acropora cervicornis]|uniref:Uncharacterized protein n=1 Tax=Acropora cervicornis TaxID=6130 RepID=A0AAD9QM25_ACRCE|nr:hypothetical protein P5673_012801 [Acropora cervicornis]
MNSTAEGNLHSSHMKAHDEDKQQLHEVLADYSADVYSAVEVESGGCGKMHPFQFEIGTKAKYAEE